jgi:hypothetical protein
LYERTARKILPVLQSSTLAYFVPSSDTKEKVL